MLLLQKQQNDAENEEAEDEEEVAAAQQGTFDYLLSMQLYSLTAEKVAQLQSEAEQMEAEVARLRALTGKDMWANDLELFMQVGAHCERTCCPHFGSLHLDQQRQQSVA